MKIGTTVERGHSLSQVQYYVKSSLFYLLQNKFVCLICVDNYFGHIFHYFHDKHNKIK